MRHPLLVAPMLDSKISISMGSDSCWNLTHLREKSFTLGNQFAPFYGTSIVSEKNSQRHNVWHWYPLKKLQAVTLDIVDYHLQNIIIK